VAHEVAGRTPEKLAAFRVENVELNNTIANAQDKGQKRFGTFPGTGATTSKPHTRPLFDQVDKMNRAAVTQMAPPAQPSLRTQQSNGAAVQGMQPQTQPRGQLPTKGSQPTKGAQPQPAGRTNHAFPKDTSELVGLTREGREGRGKKKTDTEKTPVDVPTWLQKDLNGNAAHIDELWAEKVPKSKGSVCDDCEQKITVQTDTVRFFVVGQGVRLKKKYVKAIHYHIDCLSNLPSLARFTHVQIDKQLESDIGFMQNLRLAASSLGLNIEPL
jgi:hypothetical protein